MKISLELNDKIIKAIANIMADENAYDKLEGWDDLNEMYAIAFEDGVKWVLTQIGEQKENDKDIVLNP